MCNLQRFLTHHLLISCTRGAKHIFPFMVLTFSTGKVCVRVVVGWARRRRRLEFFPCVYFAAGFLDDDDDGEDDDEPNLGARRRCVANESHLRQSVLRVRFADEFMLRGCGCAMQWWEIRNLIFSRRHFEEAIFYNICHFEWYNIENINQIKIISDFKQFSPRCKPLPPQNYFKQLLIGFRSR